MQTAKITPTPIDDNSTQHLIVYKINTLTDHCQDQFALLDKHIDKLDARLWQIIMLLLAYPLGLMVGKICHVF